MIDRRFGNTTVQSRIGAFEYFGAVPGRWIIDSLKAGVDKTGRKDLRFNPSIHDFARHCGVAVLFRHGSCDGEPSMPTFSRADHRRPYHFPPVRDELRVRRPSRSW